MLADRLNRWERMGLALGGLLLVAFGTLITLRSAYMMNPKTDFQVYARAGWAVRSGGEIYDVIDNNGWHFAYTPVFAVAMVPLGDPYPFLPRDGYLPFAASVAIWYLLSVVAIGYAAHAFAGAVLPHLASGSRGWWYARLVPLYFCIGSMGHTLGRGQVNTFVVALIAAGFASTTRGRRALGGAWLALAAIVKIIPALLVLVPLVRRDGRGLLGAAAAVALFVGVIPSLVWGPEKAMSLNADLARVVLGPVFDTHGDQVRAKELHGIGATDSQSVRAAAQAWLHPDPETRPTRAEPLANFAHLAVAAAMILATAVVGWRKLGPSPADQLVFLGCACAVMLLATPVSHMHYYAFAYPLVAGLWLRSLAERPGSAIADRRTLLLLLGWSIATCVPLFPGPVFDRLRESGLGAAATLALWAGGLHAIARSRQPVASTPPIPAPRLAA